jgi:hypothetical protein
MNDSDADLPHASCVALANLHVTKRRHDDSAQELHERVTQARAAGCSWRQIAEALDALPSASYALWHKSRGIP